MSWGLGSLVSWQPHFLLGKLCQAKVGSRPGRPERVTETKKHQDRKNGMVPRRALGRMKRGFPLGRNVIKQGEEQYCTDPILMELWNSALDDQMRIVDLFLCFLSYLFCFCSWIIHTLAFMCSENCWELLSASHCHFTPHERGFITSLV